MAQPLLKHLISGLALVAICSLATTTSVHAADLDGLSITPAHTEHTTKPYFQYFLSPGQSTVDSVIVHNTSTSAKTVSLYAVDAAPTSQNGFSMAAEYAKPTDVGSWIHMETETITLPAKSARSVSFIMTVPKAVSVGSHYGGIVAQASTAAPNNQAPATNVTIIPRVGARIYETVSGNQQPVLEVHQLSAHLSQGKLIVRQRLHNTGNTNLAPVGTLTIRNLFGRAIATQAINSGEIIKPGQTSEATTSFAIPGGLPQRYNVQASYSYANRIIAAQTALWTNAKLVIGFVVALTIASLIWWRYYRKTF